MSSDLVKRLREWAEEPQNDKPNLTREALRNIEELRQRLFDAGEGAYALLALLAHGKEHATHQSVMGMLNEQHPSDQS